MKKLLIVLIALFVYIGAEAQYVYPLTPDTLTAVEVEYFGTKMLETGNDITLQVLCTELGGTSDGTVWIDVSLDGLSWETLTSTAYLMYAFPNDTLTIVSGAVGVWTIRDNPYAYCRVAATGTASDTTLIVPKYFIPK